MMSWLGHPASRSISAFGDGGYRNPGSGGGFADLREWMDIPKNVRMEDIESLFEPRERAGFVFEDGDVEEEEEEIGDREGEEIVVDEEEDGMEGTQPTLDIVLEELKRGHVIARKSA